MTTVTARLQVITACIDCIHMRDSHVCYCALESDKKAIPDTGSIPDWCRMPAITLGDRNYKHDSCN